MLHTPPVVFLSNKKSCHELIHYADAAARLLLGNRMEQR